MQPLPEAQEGLETSSAASSVADSSAHSRAEWSAPLASTARRAPVARELERISGLVFENRRISFEDGLYLHEHADLL
ncbi:MAG: hypothetical protein ABI054_09040, partial [Planctomycetota bacterium]